MLTLPTNSLNEVEEKCRKIESVVSPEARKFQTALHKISATENQPMSTVKDLSF